MGRGDGGGKVRRQGGSAEKGERRPPPIQKEPERGRGRACAAVDVADQVLRVGHQPEEAGDPVAEEDEREDDAGGPDGLGHPELLQGPLQALAKWQGRATGQKKGKAHVRGMAASAGSETSQKVIEAGCRMRARWLRQSAPFGCPKSTHAWKTRPRRKMRARRSSRRSWMSFSCVMRVLAPSAAEKSTTAESKGTVEKRSIANQKER